MVVRERNHEGDSPSFRVYGNGLTVKARGEKLTSAVSPKLLKTRPDPFRVTLSTPRRSPRIAAIDRFRGLIMVLMALDHTRDFFFGFTPNPTDLDATTPALFATRWITHICAPGFLLLTGLSAWIRGQSLSIGQLAGYLLSRGLFLVLLEITFVTFAWIPVLDHSIVLLQVIWAIGWSLVILAGLVWLPLWITGGLGLALLALHPLASAALAAFGVPEWLNVITFAANATLETHGIRVIVSYPILPWTVVMAIGYALGPLLGSHGNPRSRRAIVLGTFAATLFVAIRAVNVGGDPVHWTAGDTLVESAMSFLNAEKYPPSPLYLLMTIGPVLIFLGLFDRARNSRIIDALEVFGRAPLFFYILHLYALRIAGLAAAAMVWGPQSLGPPPLHSTPEWPLWSVWLIWLIAIALLFPPTRWFAELRARRRGWTAWL